MLDDIEGEIRGGASAITALAGEYVSALLLAEYLAGRWWMADHPLNGGGRLDDEATYQLIRQPGRGGAR